MSELSNVFSAWNKNQAKDHQTYFLYWPYSIFHIHKIPDLYRIPANHVLMWLLKLTVKSQWMIYHCLLCIQKRSMIQLLSRSSHTNWIENHWNGSSDTSVECWMHSGWDPINDAFHLLHNLLPWRNDWLQTSCFHQLMAVVYSLFLVLLSFDWCHCTDNKQSTRCGMRDYHYSVQRIIN